MGLSNQFVARVTGKGANVINRFLMNWQLVDDATLQSIRETAASVIPMSRFAIIGTGSEKTPSLLS